MAVHFGVMPLSAHKRPETTNPRLWASVAVAVAATAVAVRQRRARQRRAEGPGRPPLFAPTGVDGSPVAKRWVAEVPPRWMPE
jgi:hypothetical protein